MADAHPTVGGLGANKIYPLVFEKKELDYPLPGMSDVMPYASTRFSRMNDKQIHGYRQAWLSQLRAVIAQEKPDLIHSHHIWILSSLVKDCAGDIPVVTHCHATGLRQMQLCPHLAESVRKGCARNEQFVVLHQEHARQLVDELKVMPERVEVVGAGFRDEIFHRRDRQPRAKAGQLLYVGKFSRAKGLPCLLTAFECLAREDPDIRLHLAGSGEGAEAVQIEAQARELAPKVVLHGQLKQAALAELMRKCDVCVLPSFYEGVPLVLVEALACGCQLVATRLPGVMSQIATVADAGLELVSLPRLHGIDDPYAEDLPAFTRHLGQSINRALAKKPVAQQVSMEVLIKHFGWKAVFKRVEEIWKNNMERGGVT